MNNNQPRDEKKQHVIIIIISITIIFIVSLLCCLLVAGSPLSPSAGSVGAAVGLQLSPSLTCVMWNFDFSRLYY